jgi:AraC-like DNA-binding protein
MIMNESIFLPPTALLLTALFLRAGMAALFLFLSRKTDWRLNLILLSVFLFSSFLPVTEYLLGRETAVGLSGLALLAVAAGSLAGPAVLLCLRVRLTGRFFSIRDDLVHVILLPIAFGLLVTLAVLENDRVTYRNLDTISTFLLLFCGAFYLWHALALVVRMRRKGSGEKRPVLRPILILSDYLALLLLRAAALIARGAADPGNDGGFRDLYLLFAVSLTAAEVLALCSLGGVRLFRMLTPVHGVRLSPEDVTKTVKLVRERVELKKGYRHPHLSQKMMARALGIPHRELGRVMEERFSSNFTDYVNALRVKEAVALLERFAGQRTILGLSLQAGFESRALFIKSFRKLTGFTPREYVKNFKKLG